MIERALDVQSESQATIKAQPKDIAVIPSWEIYGRRKLEKGKAVHHQKEGQNISWISGGPPLIVVTTPDKHDIFLW